MKIKHLLSTEKKVAFVRRISEKTSPSTLVGEEVLNSCCLGDFLFSRIGINFKTNTIQVPIKFMNVQYHSKTKNFKSNPSFLMEKQICKLKKWTSFRFSLITGKKIFYIKYTVVSLISSVNMNYWVLKTNLMSKIGIGLFFGQKRNKKAKTPRKNEVLYVIYCVRSEMHNETI